MWTSDQLSKSYSLDKHQASNKRRVKQTPGIDGQIWNKRPRPHLKGHGHAILVHFKNKKYVLTSINGQK